jgi:hypothetical protein
MTRRSAGGTAWIRWRRSTIISNWDNFVFSNKSTKTETPKASSLAKPDKPKPETPKPKIPTIEKPKKKPNEEQK